MEERILIYKCLEPTRGAFYTLQQYEIDKNCAVCGSDKLVPFKEKDLRVLLESIPKKH